MGILGQDSRQLTPQDTRMRGGIVSILLSAFSIASAHSFTWGWNSGSAYSFLQQGLNMRLPQWRFLNLPFPNNQPNPGWMVANIPGNSVEMGNEVMEYVTPFSLEINDDF